MVATVNIAVGPPPQPAYLASDGQGNPTYQPNPQFWQWLNLMWKWSTNFGNNSNASIGGWKIGATTLSATSGGNTTILSSGSTSFTSGPTGSPVTTITQAGLLSTSNINVTGGNINTSGYGLFSGNSTVSGQILSTNVQSALYGQSNVDTAARYTASVFGYNGYTGAISVGQVGVAGIVASGATNAYGIFGYASGGVGVFGYSDASGGNGVRGRSTHASGTGVVAENTGGGVALAVLGTMTLASQTIGTGAATATFPGNNKPGSNTSNTWITLSINSTTYYIPAWT